MTMNKLTKKHVKKSISDATRQKIREARARQIMKPMSEETKRKIGKANKGKTNPRKGTKGLHKHSQETKNKLAMIKKTKILIIFFNIIFINMHFFFSFVIYYGYN